MPHNHKNILTSFHKATPEIVHEVIENAMTLKHVWEDFPWEICFSKAMKAVELTSKKYRFSLLAAIMLS